MTLDPLLSASPAIQIHAFAAILAFVLGALVLFRRKGDRWHRVGGRVWVAAMLVVCLSSFFIHTIRTFGPFSPIHLLSIGTPVALWFGVRHARMRNIIAHMRTMQITYVGALVIAGGFTFLPGRIMNEVLFGGPNPAEGVALVSMVAVAAIGMAAWRLRAPIVRRLRLA